MAATETPLTPGYVPSIIPDIARGASSYQITSVVIPGIGAVPALLQGGPYSVTPITNGIGLPELPIYPR